MIIRVVHLDRENWDIYIFMDTERDDAEYIIGVMTDLDITKRQEEVAWENLCTRWKPNTGITASMPWNRTSVTVISRQTSIREFINTYAHELNRLEMHIGKACGYDPYGDNASVLSGEMSSKILCEMFRA